MISIISFVCIFAYLLFVKEHRNFLQKCRNLAYVEVFLVRASSFPVDCKTASEPRLFRLFALKPSAKEEDLGFERFSSSPTDIDLFDLRSKPSCFWNFFCIDVVCITSSLSLNFGAILEKMLFLLSRYRAYTV